MSKIILWNYQRGTWQYDLFCLMIIAFIFLTPKTWFNKGEKTATQTMKPRVQVQDFSPDRKLVLKSKGFSKTEIAKNTK